jgi:hypothetical protein
MTAAVVGSVICCTLQAIDISIRGRLVARNTVGALLSLLRDGDMTCRQ